MAEFKNELILQTESGQSVSIDLRNALVLGSAPTSSTAARAGMQAYVVSGGTITAEYVCTAASGGVYTWVLREISGGTDKELEGKVDDLEAAVTEDGGNSQELWEQGSIGDSGNMISSTQCLRTTGYISKFVAKVHTNYPYSFKLYAYNDAGTYVGVWNGSGFAKSGSVWITELDLSQFGGMNYRYRVTFRSDNDATVTPESYTYINFTNAMYSAIEAVRTESAEKFGDLSDVLSDVLSGDICPKNLTTKTSNGIVYTMRESGDIYITGKSTSDSYFTISQTNNGLPANFEKGVKYALEFDGIYPKLSFQARYLNAEGVWIVMFTTSNSVEFEIPADAVGFQFRLWIRPNQTVNDFVHPRIYIEGSDGYNKIVNVRTPKPMLTIIYDDGHEDFYNYVLPIVQSKHIPISSAIITEYAEAGTSGFMTWDKLTECYMNGVEILTHDKTRSEAEWNELGVQNIAMRYLVARNKLTSKGLNPPPIFVFSGGSSGYLTCLKACMSSFVGGFTASDGGINYCGAIEPYRITRMSSDGKTIDTLKSWIDGLFAAGTGWMVWTRHNSNSSTEDPATAAQILADAIDYAIEKGILIVPVARGFAEYLDT